MNFLELALKRESVRLYDTKKVEREKILHCVESARLAPSACNSQPWHFIIVDDDSLLEKLAPLTVSPVAGINRWVKTAPVIIAAVSEGVNISSKIGGILGRKKYNVIDLSIAVENICLAAADMDLGSCILGWFRERRIKRLLGIPFRKKLLLLITLGYPVAGYKPRSKSRKPIEQIYSFNSYKG